jgi:hypothetical protein
MSAYFLGEERQQEGDGGQLPLVDFEKKKKKFVIKPK